MQSVDFFTPIVDDPYLFGAIAAANSLSDLYAMGATPLTAMNIVGFPPCMELDVLQTILKGGADKVLASGAVLAGGHTVEDEEPKYGLAVTGEVHPHQLLTTKDAQVGDQLLLTKPLGTGLIATGLKGDVLSAEQVPEALHGMAALNAGAAAAARQVGVHASTDVTGFGLLGHACEMAAASQVCLVLISSALPAYPQALEMAEMVLVPAGSHRNRHYYQPQCQGLGDADPLQLDLLTDPQTSGGLLLAVDAENRAALQQALQEQGCDSWHIGAVNAGPAGQVQVV